jgi:tRNA (cytidine/uridine-2'-O-)-methyltransferase
MFQVVLVEPEIPSNTGNIARTCSATGAKLHLVKPLGFSLEDKYLKRAGLDYWDSLALEIHDSWEAFREKTKGGTFYYASTKAKGPYSDFTYKKDDFFVFGKETAGLPESLLAENMETCIRIPMKKDQRSLNLSNSVAIILYEGYRQNHFALLESEGFLRGDQGE